jgi:hypothetical protein
MYWHRFLLVINMKTLVKKIISADSLTERKRKACLRKFLYYFKKGYTDAKYIAWERDYKWQAHLLWEQQLGKRQFAEMLKDRRYGEIAQTATRIESKTNLLFSFEKMALRDAVKSKEGAELFAQGLYDYLYGSGSMQSRFESFTTVIEQLPRKQTRVLTWPLHTVFGFIARPDEHIFLKPKVTKASAEKYGYPFNYRSRPNWETYHDMLEFAAQVRKDTLHLRPRDYIDLQSFIWVMGSDEYPD